MTGRLGFMLATSCALALLPVRATAQDEGPSQLPTIPADAEAPALPADPEATPLDTIVVTASKRDKAQRDIAGSVGAIRGEELEAMAAQGMADYLKRIPGVSLTDFGADRQIPVIRGIAVSAGFANVSSQFTALTTGVYLDDMPFNDLFFPLTVPDLNPFDLERVEVLKGPQGTLFGAGALAGAVRFIVQKPNPAVWQTKASATVSQNRLSERLSETAAIALNAPLPGSAAVRLVGLLRDDAGFYDALPQGTNTRNEQDVDRLEQFTGRVLAHWDATDELTLSAFHFGQDTDQADRGSANQTRAPSRDDVPFQSPSESAFGGTNLTAAYDLGWSQLLYSGNVLEKKSRLRFHLERVLPDQGGAQQDASWYRVFRGRTHGYTHELRLSSPGGGDVWEWLAGAAYLNYDQYVFDFSPNPGQAGTGYYAREPEDFDDVPEEDRPNVFYVGYGTAEAYEAALFGEGTRRFGDDWEVTLGARIFETAMDTANTNSGEQVVVFFPGETVHSAAYSMRERGINPKLALRYLHDRNVQAFGLIAKGFQFGGNQLQPPIAAAESTARDEGFEYGPYRSSDLWNYELGLRTEWLERRLRFDITGFYQDWTDLQLTIGLPIAPSNPAPPETGIPQDPVTVGFITNVSEAHSQGLEAALEASPFPGATFHSSAAWIEALTDEPFDKHHPQGPVPAGTRLPGTPRFQWTNVLAYEFALPLAPGWVAGVSFTHAHTGSAPNSIRRTGDVGGFDTLDVRFSLADMAHAWWPETILGVTNLTDTRGVVAYDGDGSVIHAYSFVRPRTTLLTLAWKY